MPTRYDLSDPEQHEQALSAAVSAIRRGELVVMPTDTVYGLAADAFDPEAVTRLLRAKGRGRDMPPPVLVSSTSTLDALSTGVPGWARVLVDHYWPGPLTIVVRQQSSLRWDLGDARGTVAVRMPNHPMALELLNRTGPLAVSSANQSGLPAATDADQAEEMLARQVEVILDDGSSPGEAASSILDCTADHPRLLREGALSFTELAALLDSHDVELEDLTHRA